MKNCRESLIFYVQAQHCGRNTEVCPVEEVYRDFWKHLTPVCSEMWESEARACTQPSNCLRGSREEQPAALDEEARPLLGSEVADQDDTKRGVSGTPEVFLKGFCISVLFQFIDMETPIQLLAKALRRVRVLMPSPQPSIHVYMWQHHHAHTYVRSLGKI